MVRQYTSCISKFYADTCTLSVPIFLLWNSCDVKRLALVSQMPDSHKIITFLVIN